MSLVGWWPLDGDATDRVGSNDGTVNGASSTSGKVGGALDFGGNDTIDLGTFDTYGPQFSMATWVNLDDHTGTNGNDCTIGLNVYGSNNGFRVYLSGNDLGLWAKDNGSTVNTVSNFSMPLNEWVHVVATSDGSTLRLYANGTEVSSTDVGNVSPFDGQALIGEYTGGDSYLDGQQQDVRFYDHALSEKEVARLSRGKVLHYKMNQQGSVTDATGRGNDGYLSGPSFIQDAPIGSGAYQFTRTDRITTDSSFKINDHTISFWIRQEDALDAAYEEIVSNGTGSESGGRLPTIYIHAVGDGSLHWRWSTDIFGNEGLDTPAGTLEQGNWVHLVGVKEGNKLDIYKNGSLLDSVTLSSSGAGTDYGDFALRDESSNSVTLSMDDVRFYATPLSETDIQSLYEQRASIDAGGTTHVHELNEQVDSGLTLTAFSRGNDS